MLDDTPGQEPATETTDDAATTITVEDNFGTQTVTVPPQSVVATDNSTFETLDTWGIPLTAGAVTLMPDTISYTEDADMAPLFVGLPDDSCQCPHWGIVLKGSLTYHYKGGSETIGAGEAYFAPPGHTPELHAGTDEPAEDDADLGPDEPADETDEDNAVG